MSEMPPEKPRALVAGHAEFAAGLVSAVELICGRGSALLPIQVAGLCGADIEALLASTLEANGVRVIFTDLQAGSCTMAARRMTRGLEGAVVICGTNLPMLLDFVLSGDADLGLAAARAAERGRASVSVFGVDP